VAFKFCSGLPRCRSARGPLAPPSLSMFTYACSPTVEHREASSSRVGQYAPFPDPTGDMVRRPGTFVDRLEPTLSRLTRAGSATGRRPQASRLGGSSESLDTSVACRCFSVPCSSSSSVLGVRADGGPGDAARMLPSLSAARTLPGQRPGPRRAGCSLILLVLARPSGPSLSRSEHGLGGDSAASEDSESGRT
jgi:hypothetical protein